VRVWASALTLGEDDHGCAPLPIGDDIITAVQEADPRPLTRAP
jgi:hypothetical protein